MAKVIFLEDRRKPEIGFGQPPSFRAARQAGVAATRRQVAMVDELAWRRQKREEAAEDASVELDTPPSAGAERIVEEDDFIEELIRKSMNPEPLPL